MEELKVTRNYQVTIPASIREKLKIRVGDRLLIYTEGEKIVMVKKSGNISNLNLRLGKSFKDEDVNEDLREAVERSGSDS
jgi:AbrB family looped-hinge helix DNA binding protein